MHKWAVVLSFIALQTTGGAEASAILTLNTLEGLVLQAINNHASGRPLQAVQQVLADATDIVPPQNATDLIDRIQKLPQQGVSAFVGPEIIGNSTSLFNGLVVISDPELFSDTSAKLTNAVLGSVIAASGINFSPCVVVTGPVDAAVFAEAISIAPQVIQLSETGAALVSVAININPTLISISTTDKAEIAAGVSITPTLISIAPTLEADISVGATAPNSDPLLSVEVPKPPHPAEPPNPPKPADPPKPHKPAEPPTSAQPPAP